MWISKGPQPQVSSNRRLPDEKVKIEVSESQNLWSLQCWLLARDVRLVGSGFCRSWTFLVPLYVGFARIKAMAFVFTQNENTVQWQSFYTHVVTTPYLINDGSATWKAPERPSVVSGWPREGRRGFSEDLASREPCFWWGLKWAETPAALSKWGSRRRSRSAKLGACGWGVGRVRVSVHLERPQPPVIQSTVLQACSQVFVGGVNIWIRWL